MRQFEWLLSFKDEFRTQKQSFDVAKPYKLRKPIKKFQKVGTFWKKKSVWCWNLETKITKYYILSLQKYITPQKSYCTKISTKRIAFHQSRYFPFFKNFLYAFHKFINIPAFFPLSLCCQMLFYFLISFYVV